MALSGQFRQAALGSILTLTVHRDGVIAQFNAPVGEKQPLQWVGPDNLSGADYVLRIERGAQGKPKAVIYNHERVRGLRYERQP